MTEIVDRSSIGYPSHFLFSSEFLSRCQHKFSIFNFLSSRLDLSSYRNLLLLNDKFSRVSTVFSSAESERYFKFPLATTSFNQSHVTSILTIPMIEGETATFEEKKETYQDGFVILQNFQFTARLTFAQYEDCVTDFKRTETFCLVRPCLVRSDMSSTTFDPS